MWSFLAAFMPLHATVKACKACGQNWKWCNRGRKFQVINWSIYCTQRWQKLNGSFALYDHFRFVQITVFISRLLILWVTFKSRLQLAGGYKQYYGSNGDEENFWFQEERFRRQRMVSSFSLQTTKILLLRLAVNKNQRSHKQYVWGKFFRRPLHRSR